MNMSRETLHSLIDVVDPSDIDTIIKVLLKFVPEDIAAPDEIEALRIGEQEIANGETVPADQIDWS